MTRFEVGDAGRTVDIDPGWHVLDVGSGQAPHPRADVLLEKYVEDDWHRAGGTVDCRDPRLVVGDAAAMPFADREFDYVIASHIAEHVDDPVGLCRELARVGAAGYLETPGWLGDMLLREPFHIWRVRRRGDVLVFTRVTDPRPLGLIGDAFYAALYATVRRDGHWTPNPTFTPLRFALKGVRRALALAIRAPGIRPLFYLCFEWKGPIQVEVEDD